MSENGKFHYVYSCDLDVNIQIKIGTLEGERCRPTHIELINDPILRFSGICQDTCSDLFVTCQVLCDGRPLALPVRTAYKAFSMRWNWNEWINLPVKFSDIPRNAQLALTIWDIYGPRRAVPVGGTTISLFGKRGTLRQGMYDLKVWPGLEADGTFDTTTPGKTSGKEDEISRLAKLGKHYREGHMAKVDWLDRLTLREIEMIKEKQKRDSNFMYLMIEFPHVHFDGIDYTVVYFEMGGDEVHQIRQYAEIVTVPDPEIEQENIVENKHHKLARSLRSGPTDKDLKPNASTRDHLNTIVGYPPTKVLSSEERDLIWKFRFYLSSSKKALTKFLKSVNWGTQQEAKQALDLLSKWVPMDTEDSLELLSAAFTHPAVRKYAINRLQQADDEELLVYLLQLVQALKYENFDDIMAAHDREQEQTASPTVPTTPFVRRRQQSADASNVREEGEEGESEEIGYRGSIASSQLTPEINADQEAPTFMQDSLALIEDALEDGGVAMQIDTDTQQELDLATFLIRRACSSEELANYFCWYLLVECDEKDTQAKDTRIVNMYVTVLKRFSLALKRGGRQCQIRRASIFGQQVFVEKLVLLAKTIAKESGNRIKKIEKLKKLLKDPDELKYNFSNFDPIPMPLDPNVIIKGIKPESASLFKSALMPCRFTFITTDNQEYITIFKHGDDLRQDQLVLQIITLMDKLLRKENLDLKLTPYKVLATSSVHGFMQFIESLPLAEIIEKEGSITNYLRKLAPSETAPMGVSKELMDNYIKSCAGYCVITYILGVGDRHLDNLLMTKTGKLVHVDFGYILGRDPKPMPPPMKLSKEMVEAMGGVSSEYFSDFKQLCYTAFLHLRRSSNLILNLFSLMVDANVPDIALEPDKAVKKVQDKFCLDLSDEEAVQYMQSLIDVSVTATMAALMEKMHAIAQYWRK